MKAFFQATGLAVAVSLSAMAMADTATGTGSNPERVFAFNGAMPTGVTVTETGRIFINFPRWGDDVPYTVAEIKQGHLVPYPDLKTNVENAKDPAAGFISVQSVVADGQGRVWVLDTAAPAFSEPKAGGAKLIAIDLNTNKIVKTVVFPRDVILPTTYVNDVRFDFRVGKEGTAYVTDSSVKGPGGIIVLDLASGTATRRLSGAKSTSVDPEFRPVIEGKPALITRDAQGKSGLLTVASDGIALSSDGKTLYFCPLSSRHLYSVPTALLRDPNVSEAELEQAVVDLGEKGASDGLEADANGAVYAGDYEHNSIRKRLADGTWQTVVEDSRVLWPDTLSIGPDGYLYFTANQLHRSPGFNDGQDKRVKPYSLMRVKIDAKPAPTH
ncbi:L-dopachrome tautomerase-related protein [Pseudomonas vlassakiae]|jgi:sugar lactone lactonase YvrE|uniref:L-dopachrome tautomerase-related protein n=2 Tax=Pseudomonas TaxID=286 RepID=UPI000C18BC36|nr:gluconolaconase [Stenotrophomonas rhizophila]MBS3185742.1 gluconolaconase [Pseudomonas sp. PCH44]PIK80304.1 gluconolaconase [Pseudomonas sp. 382]TXI01039.1 MAG: gluconolaconase [Pseudomonas monteilii]